MGEAIAKSRMFGCENVEQGKVFAWECFSRKCSPLSLTETYHVIDGKLSMRADAMLARFIEQGGRHAILERTPNRAAVQLFQDGESQEFAFTWEEAQAESGLTTGKNGVKTNWSTPRRRMQMLWARVVSDGVRAMAPQVCSGKYTPEDFGHSVDNQEDGDWDAADVVQADQVVTVEVTPTAAPVVKTEPAPATKPATVVEPAGAASSEKPVTAAQKARIRELVELLAAHDALDGALRKRGVSSVNSLTTTQAGEILARLEAARLKAELAREVTGASKLPTEATSAALAGPCSQVQIDRAKALVMELEQVKPGSAAKIKQKLQAAGMQKIADLSMSDCDALLQQLAARNIEAFFTAALSKPVAAGNPTGN
jgi:hypothetical protein